MNRSLKLHGSHHIRHNLNFAKEDKGTLQGFYTNHYFTSQLLEKAQDKLVNLSKKIRLQQFYLLTEQKPNNNSKESVELQI